MNQKGFANIVLIVVIVAIVVVGGYFVFSKKSEPVIQEPNPTQTKTTNPTEALKQNTVTGAEKNKQAVCNSSSLPSIKVLSPNGGEVWKIGQTYTIKWSTCNVPVDSWVKLSHVVPSPVSGSYAPNGTDNCLSDSGEVLASQGSYSWEISNSFTCSDAVTLFQPNTSFKTKMKIELYTGRLRCGTIPGPNTCPGSSILHAQDESDNYFTVTNLS